MESTSMNDLGESYPSSPCGCSDCEDREKGKGEQKKHYPRESFTTQQMPELKGMNVGDKVKVIIECEVCSVSQGEEYPMPGEGDDEEVKTRMSLKMLRGSATKMSDDTTTMADEQKKKEKNFNKSIGLDDSDENDQEENSEAK